MNDPGLTSWLENKRKREPIAYVVVTRGADAEGAVDRLDAIAGESDEELAQRVTDCAKSDAKAFTEPEPYFVHVFREGSEYPEARRSIQVPSAPASLNEDEHQVLGITMHGLTESHRTMVQLARLGLEKDDGEKMRLVTRLQQLEDRYFSDLFRMRGMLLAEEDLADRREERRERAQLFKKALEQMELLLPVGVSYLMHGDKKDDPAAAGVLEAQLLQQFVISLRPEQQNAVVATLDNIQRIALAELQTGITKGNFAPEMVAPLVQRVMANLTREQVMQIAEICDSDDQRNKFAAVYAVRKHTLAEKTHAEMAGQRAAAALEQHKTNGG